MYFLLNGETVPRRFQNFCLYIYRQQISIDMNIQARCARKIIGFQMSAVLIMLFGFSLVLVGNLSLNLPWRLTNLDSKLAFLSSRVLFEDQLFCLLAKYCLR